MDFLDIDPQTIGACDMPSGQYMSNIIRLSTDCGVGEHWPFEQGHLVSHVPDTLRSIVAEGMCGVLAAQWILEHPRDGLEEYLRRTHPYLERHVEALAQQKVRMDRSPGLFHTPSQARNWGADLQLEYILKIGLTKIAPRLLLRRGSRSLVEFAHRFAHDVAQIHAGHPYQSISLMSQYTGHALAACVRPGRYELFDPNYGKFVFNDRRKFVSWLSMFVQYADYMTPGRLEKRYIIDYVSH